jgi:hypothetical protein
MPHFDLGYIQIHFNQFGEMLLILDVQVSWTFKWFHGKKFEKLVEDYPIGEATKWLPCFFPRKEGTFQMYQQMDLI